MSAALSSPATSRATPGPRTGRGRGPHRRRVLGLAALLGLGLPVAACTVTPDPCQGYPMACVAVTVDSGPPDVYRLLVAVLDGYGSTTPLTPRQQPSQPLIYPLRFALRFGEFDPFHKGTITFTAEALNHSDDAIAFLRQQVSVNGYEHTQTTVSFGPLPSAADLAEPTVPPDLAAPADLASLPEMP